MPPTDTPKDNGSIPFLDTLVSSGANNTLIILVYRKDTDTDQYHHCDSYHNLLATYSIFNSLTHIARVICTNQLLLQEEEDYIRKALLRCHYPTWTLDRLKNSMNHRYSVSQSPNNLHRHQTNKHNSTNNNCTSSIVSPYTKGLSKSFIKFVRKWEYRVLFKGDTPSGNFWWSLRIGIRSLKKQGNLYI